MKQDPNPTDPIETGSFKLAINGNPIPFSADMVPKLFVAYVAAVRARYYACADAAKNPAVNLEQVFMEEVRHAMRDRDEIADWMANNMDVHLEPAGEIGVLFTP